MRFLNPVLFCQTEGTYAKGGPQVLRFLFTQQEAEFLALGANTNCITLIDEYANVTVASHEYRNRKS